MANMKFETMSDEDCDEELSETRPSSPTSPAFEELTMDEDGSDMDFDSKFESLPTEMIQKIAVSLPNDVDLSNLSLTSSTFADVLNPDNADVWRKRFLAIHDHPIGLNSSDDYSVAYKLRRFVLHRLDGDALRNGQQNKSYHQLLVILDLVIETYARSRHYLPPPFKSKNLAAMSSPDSSQWILQFMSCALYGNQTAKYGRPNKLFDILQVTLSHLVLHQRSPILLRLTPSRENYDLARVYNYNIPLNTIVEVIAIKHFKSTRFPGLSSTTRKRFNVNMHTLLHIRNFWQRHFSEEGQSAAKGIGENTYVSMARNLVGLGKIPRQWDMPLSEKIPLQTKWIGHYSCLHPWPKSRESLEEQQSCAEDWDKIDPMTLELELNDKDEQHSFWPELFSSIPILQSHLPEGRRGHELNLTYIRGISSFLDVHKRKSTSDTSEESTKEIPKWHPFLASRVHGFIHDLEPQDVLGRKLKQDKFSDPGNVQQEAVVPGWKHIVMVIYKPRKANLVSTIEYAQEDYGGPSVTHNTADIWNANDNETTSTDFATGSHQTQVHNDGNDGTNATTDNGSNTELTSDSEDPTQEELNAQWEKEILERVEAFGEDYAALLAEAEAEAEARARAANSSSSQTKPKKKSLPPLFSTQHIIAMDDAFSPAQYIRWDDIDYAYAYEGAIIPGGKIMLGRWWRIGADGMGPGREIGPDTLGVELRPVVAPASSSSSSPQPEIADEGKATVKSNKRKKTTTTHQGATRKSKRVRTKGRKGHRRKRAGVMGTSTSGDEDEDWNSDGEENLKEPDEVETGVEYEFVTMLNGQESRAINATKGLERGPFVFWAD